MDVTAALEAAQTFLLAQRVGPAWDAPFETALALLAILPRLRETTLVAASLDALRTAQAADGSWRQDVYTTALALQALGLAATPVPNPDFGLLQGRVTDGDTHVALRGVTVTLSGTLDATLVTDSDGLWQFDGLPPGEYGLTLARSSYGTLTTATAMSVGGRVDLGTLPLLKSLGPSTTGTVRGVVTDAVTQAPRAGVRVEASGLTTVTGSDGSYQLSNVPAGQVTVTASLDGYATASGRAALVAGGVLVFSPRLLLSTAPPGEGVLSGVITAAATGNPLAGVTVSVTGSSTATVQTDSSGAYRIAPLGVGPLVIEVRRTGYDTVRAGATVATLTQLVFSPRLYSSGTTPPGANTSSLTGVVLDASTNVPLAGVRVEATHGGRTVVLSTAPDGRFTVTDITTAEVALRFLSSSYVTSALALPVVPVSQMDIGQIRLRPQVVTSLLPDLVLTAVTPPHAIVDPHTFALSGAIEVRLHNRGTSAAPPGVTLAVFVDANHNGAYDPDHETLLGQATSAGALAVGSTATLAIPVHGVLPFRDAPLSVWVDSARAVAESVETNNVTTSAASCRTTPEPVGTLAPVLRWQWTGSPIVPASNQVMAAPVVIDLDGDGIPEVVFGTFRSDFLSLDHVLRAVRGSDGQELWAVTTPRIYAWGSLAAGDIDGDGRPEILAVDLSQASLPAFEHDGTFKWRSPALPDGSIGGGGAALADLDGDGTPEIIVGRTVLNANGTIRWSGAYGRGAAYFGPLSLVADLDGDGRPEVVAGNTAYHADGRVYWRNVQLSDGLNAVGNFNDDPHPEIVLVTQGRVYLLAHDGTIIWGPVFHPGGGIGGAPTVADVDGDGMPEIGVAGSNMYTVFESNGAIKWSAPIRDTSAYVTGSSVFDFDGDGMAEIVYGDELKLRIFRGSDGTVLWETPSPSGTVYELPVVVDVDADGHADIIKVSNNYAVTTQVPK